RAPLPTLFPYTTLFRSWRIGRYRVGKWSLANVFSDFEGIGLVEQFVLDEVRPNEFFVVVAFRDFRRSIANDELLRRAWHDRFDRSEEHTSELQSRENLV